MANFPTKPTLSQGESPSLYSSDYMDNANAAPSEGGYEFRRRRFLRAPRLTFETGFINMPHADYVIVEQFWGSHQKDVPFTWFDYLHDVNRQVRFDEFKAEYVGVGTNRMWTVKIKMSEV